MRKACCAAVLVLGVLALAESAPAQTKKVTYPITDLGTLGADRVQSNAMGINNLGQVVGRSSTRDGSAPGHAFVWDGAMHDLGSSVPEYDSTAYSVNDYGQVVGFYRITDTTYGPCLWEYVGGQWTMTHLGGLGTGSATAAAINNCGQIAGGSYLDGALHHACLWEYVGGQWNITDLLTPNSHAYSINDLGQVAGYYYVDATTRHACLWQSVGGQWVMTDLGALVPSLDSYAKCINDFGQVVGYATGGHACLWECVGGQWTLTDLGGRSAAAINNVGQVAGYSNSPIDGSHACLWDSDGTMHDLNDFLPAGWGWPLNGANAINDGGQIAGWGANSPDFISRAFVMDTSAPSYSYTSTGSAVAIKDKASASKAMTLTDNYTILDLDVSVNLTHSRYADLKIEFIGPDNVARVLCNAGGVTGSGTKTLVFDDEGAAGTIRPVQPLSYYDFGSIQGTWTLRVTDTVKNNKTGSLTNWTLTVVPETP